MQCCMVIMDQVLYQVDDHHNKPLGSFFDHHDLTSDHVDDDDDHDLL